MTISVRPLVTGKRSDLYIGEITWANLLAVASPQDGWTAQVTDLGNNGRSLWVYSSSRARWIPAGGSYIHYKKWGSVASPIASHTGVTGLTFFTIAGGNPQFPANLLSAGSEAYLRGFFRKSGGNSTVSFFLNLGTSDNSVMAQPAQLAVAAADGACWRCGVPIAFSGLTSFTTPAFMLENQAGTTISDQASGVNAAALMYLSFGSFSSHAADTMTLIGISVEVKP